MGNYKTVGPNGVLLLPNQYSKANLLLSQQWCQARIKQSSWRYSAQYATAIATPPLSLLNGWSWPRPHLPLPQLLPPHPLKCLSYEGSVPEGRVSIEYSGVEQCSETPNLPSAAVSLSVHSRTASASPPSATPASLSDLRTARKRNGGSGEGTRDTQTRALRTGSNVLAVGGPLALELLKLLLQTGE